MLRNVFDENKANLESSLENLLIPLANQYLNELTLQDLLSLIGGESDGTDGPVFDSETGDLICHANAEPPTSEHTPTADTSPSENPTTADTSSSENPTTADTSPSGIPTLPDESTTDKGIESTTLLVPDDEPNSSNFLFHKFQVMIFTIATIMSLRIL